jgi:hypothetical protein
MFTDLPDQAQASLFSPTGPVMARALCRQIETRIAKLEPYLSSQESYRLHAELSLVCVAIERIEARVIGLPEYRLAQLAAPAAPSTPPEAERLLSWHARRGRTFATRSHRERAIV